MKELSKKLNDKIVTFEDMLPKGGAFEIKSPFRTEITATDEFGDVLFTMEHNMVVIGGALTVLEKLWNVRSPLKIATINSTELMNIHPAKDTGSTTAILPKENHVCLWGIGIGGCGDAFGSVRDVKFYEREIGQNGTKGTQMIPFRVVPVALVGDEANKYWLKKQNSDGTISYYGKSFETDPFIRSLWQDGPEGEDGTEVSAGVHDTSRSENIECFVEMHLKLSKDDVREYFERAGNIEGARVNTIGLFTATKVAQADGTYDYNDVKLFSKFNFDNEALSNKKEINFTYRVYVS